MSFHHGRHWGFATEAWHIVTPRYKFVFYRHEAILTLVMKDGIVTAFKSLFDYQILDLRVLNELKTIVCLLNYKGTKLLYTGRNVLSKTVECSILAN